MIDGASGYLWMNVNKPVSQPTSSVLNFGSVCESSSEELGSEGRLMTTCWSKCSALRRLLCIFFAIDVLKFFLLDRSGDGANRPYMPANELRF